MRLRRKEIHKAAGDLQDEITKKPECDRMNEGKEFLIVYEADDIRLIKKAK
jgi:hypothetical protein